MKCRPAQKYISEYVDETLKAGRLSELRAHLAGCAGCRAFLEDFQEIAGQAKNLAPLAPPDRVWLKIRAGLREQRTASPESPASFSAPYRPRYGFRFALASTAALLLVAGGLVVFQPWKSGPTHLNAEKAALNQKTLDKLNEAEWHYNQAIKALREAVGSQAGSLDPQTAAVFAANLGIIDASIEACRQAVLSDPRDLGAQNALLASYSEKVQVLTAWVQAQSAAGAGQKPSTQL